MRIQIRVIARAKQRDIHKRPDGSFVVKVTEPAEEDRANAAVVEALAEHFDVPKRTVRIVRGLASRRKEVEIWPSPG